jgi:hypothetical protein
LAKVQSSHVHSLELVKKPITKKLTKIFNFTENIFFSGTGEMVEEKL